MEGLGPLASQLGDRTEEANRQAAARCLANPALLDEAAAGLGRPGAALAGDCAEVMTMVAQAAPELVAPYAAQLVPLLSHKATRARWEAMHALALVAHLAPGVIEPLLPRLGELIDQDPSTIVRDYAVEAVANYARVDAVAAYPLLRGALAAFGGKHAARALSGLAHVAEGAPGLRPEIKVVAERYLGHEKGVVRKAAKRLAML